MPSLDKRQLQLWLKRLRTALAPLGLRLRFFAVGEYGSETSRPHYHAIIFGLPPCSATRTVRNYSTGQPDAANCCATCRLVHSTWGHGHVDGGTFTSDSAQYCCGYVVKKMNASNPLIGDRVPEFALMSRRPGLGVGYISELASSLLSVDVQKHYVDVPSAIRFGGKVLPLGRHLRRQLRLEVFGHADPSPLQQVAATTSMSLVPKDRIYSPEEIKTLNDEYILSHDGLRARAESHERIFGKVDKL
jgi:hypothetical protein